jgi:2-polyprenyl-3-methyl-5-hydroxy-6-metoxy-1,4-benzoquinol methylase
MGPNRKLLDVGCGVGAALMWAKEKGWEVRGIEMDPKAVEIAQAAGLGVVQGTVETAVLPDHEFDAITLNQVLEHTFSPTEALVRCRQLLRPSGVLLVSVPNFDSYFRVVMNEAWPSLELPRHLYHFNEATLTSAAEKCGFVVRQVRYRSRIMTLWSNFSSLRIYMANAKSWDPMFSPIRLIRSMGSAIPVAILNRHLRVSDNMLFVLSAAGTSSPI